MYYIPHLYLLLCNEFMQQVIKIFEVKRFNFFHFIGEFADQFCCARCLQIFIERFFIVLNLIIFNKKFVVIKYIAEELQTFAESIDNF